MGKIATRLPGVGLLLRKLRWRLLQKKQGFSDSESYWIQRYQAGGSSGFGSYNQLADFKASVLNDFVKEHRIMSVIEYGCGDGNQLKLAKYPIYVGFDISTEALMQCRRIFQDDLSKSFRLMREYDGETAELTLSLDVIFHLVEESVFVSYMERLFDSAEKFVIVYSSNVNENLPDTAPHVKYRKFTDWVEENRPAWGLLRFIPNQHPFDGDDRRGSFSDFYIFQRVEV
jgi:hypothetical protein